MLLRNDQSLGHHWVRLELVGADRNRSAIGASISVHTGDTVHHRHVMPTRSYLSQVELPVSVGLGTTSSIERVVIGWPDGARSEHRSLAVDTTHTIRQTVP